MTGSGQPDKASSETQCAAWVLPSLLAFSALLLFLPTPVGTPPNGIVFSTGRIPLRQMVIMGLWLNLIGTPILTAGTYLLIRPIMGIQNH